MRPRGWRALAILAAFVAVALVAFDVVAAPPAPSPGDPPTSGIAVPTGLDLDAVAPPTSGAGTAVRILVVLTLLSLLPAIVLTMTCFTRIIIVFTFLRQALGIQGMPPNQVLTGMALFLTAFVMAPVAADIHEHAVAPMMAEEIGTTEALVRAKEPLARFMLAHTEDQDLRLLYDVSNRPRPATRADVDFVVLAPAFILGEVRTAFEMGFLVLIPFMVIDLLVSSVLMAMGMVMLPPALISLPVKVMVFVLVDGWGLVVGSLVRSFGA